MYPIKVIKPVDNVLSSYQLPKELKFGQQCSPVMIRCSYKNSRWGDLEVLPFENISLDPRVKCLHYAQQVFEGMKAFLNPQGKPLLFRPDLNAKRFNQSLESLAMPTLSEELFETSVHAFTFLNQKAIPKKSGEFLYIRPFALATEAHLSLMPSQEFEYMVIGSPSEAYLIGEIEVLIERKASRALPGGTGNVKVGGNYAQGLKPTIAAKKLGFGQTLWLDPLKKTYVEELSGMNFFCVVDGILTTPKLTDTILNGITRQSILQLAQKLQIKTQEVSLNIEQLIEKIQSGEATEAFSCGTAAIISPIKCLGEVDGTRYFFKQGHGPITQNLRQKLLDIQEGRMDTPWNWSVPVKNIF